MQYYSCKMKPSCYCYIIIISIRDFTANNIANYCIQFYGIYTNVDIDTFRLFSIFFSRFPFAPELDFDIRFSIEDCKTFEIACIFETN